MKKDTSKAMKQRCDALAKARAAKTQKRLEREACGIFPSLFMRLTLTDDAFAITKNMTNAEFREFVSAAIRKAAKRKRGA